MKKRRKVARRYACVFLKEADAKGLPRCDHADWKVCSKKFATTKCEIFPVLIAGEKEEFESHATVWNRKPDGTRGTYHGEML